MASVIQVHEEIAMNNEINTAAAFTHETDCSLSDKELDRVTGGTIQEIKGPSGAVYYRDRNTGKIVGVDDPATGTCRAP